MISVSKVPTLNDVFLRGVLKETETTADDKLIPIDKNNILPNNLKNPSDPDITYRGKAEKAAIQFTINKICFTLLNVKLRMLTIIRK